MRLLTLLSLLLALPAQAARVELNLDPNPVQVGSRATLEVHIYHDGSTGVAVNELRLGRFKNLGTAGQFKSTRWTISGGRRQVQQETVQRFKLRAPDKPGRMRIGPVDVQAEGRTWRGPALSVEVRSNSGLAEEPRGEPLFLHLEVSPRDPVVGQQFTVNAYLFYLYRKVEVQRYSEVSHPAGKDLWWEELSLPKGARAMVHEIGGRQYVRRLIGRWAGFAEAAGPMELGGSRAVIDVQKDDGFFARVEQRELRSAPLSLDVKPLPPDVSRQQVGRYQVEAELAPDTMRVGDAAQLTLRITGAGDLAAFPVAVPTLPTGLRAFSAQRQVDLWRESELVGGTLTWSLPVQALHPGDFRIEPFSLRWFDPELGSIQAASLGPFDLRAEGEDSQAVVVPGLGDSSRPGARPVGPLGSFRDQVGLPPWSRSPWLLIVATLLALAALLPRTQSEPAEDERSLALSRLEMALETLAGEPVRGLTRQELLDHLSQRLEPADCDRLREALGELDHLSYSGQVSAQEEAEALLASWLEGLA